MSYTNKNYVRTTVFLTILLLHHDHHFCSGERNVTVEYIPLPLVEEFTEKVNSTSEELTNEASSLLQLPEPSPSPLIKKQSYYTYSSSMNNDGESGDYNGGWNEGLDFINSPVYVKKPKPKYYYKKVEAEDDENEAVIKPKLTLVFEHGKPEENGEESDYDQDPGPGSGWGKGYGKRKNKRRKKKYREQDDDDDGSSAFPLDTFKYYPGYLDYLRQSRYPPGPRSLKDILSTKLQAKVRPRGPLVPPYQPPYQGPPPFSRGRGRLYDDDLFPFYDGYGYPPEFGGGLFGDIFPIGQRVFHYVLAFLDIIVLVYINWRILSTIKIF